MQPWEKTYMFIKYWTDNSEEKHIPDGKVLARAASKIDPLELTRAGISLTRTRTGVISLEIEEMLSSITGPGSVLEYARIPRPNHTYNIAVSKEVINSFATAHNEDFSSFVKNLYNNTKLVINEEKEYQKKLIR